jgi:hypothetical protein
VEADPVNMRLRAALEILGVGISVRGRRFAIHRVRRTDLDFAEELLVICEHADLFD